MKDKTVMIGALTLASLFVTSGLAVGAVGGVFGRDDVYVPPPPLATADLQQGDSYTAEPVTRAVVVPPSPTWRVADVTAPRPQPTFAAVDAVAAELPAPEPPPGPAEPPAVEPPAVEQATVEPVAPTTVTIPPSPPAEPPVAQAPVATAPPAAPAPPVATAPPVAAERPPQPPAVTTTTTTRPVVTMPPITTRPR